jgi:hexosaminidase
MQANQTLAKAQLHTSSDNLFWLDPWSADGQAVGAKLLPVAQELRLHAEQAIVLLEQARAENPKLREAEALDAMDLGARRLDLIGMKWELCQEIVDDYAKATSLQHDKSQRSEMHTDLYEISSNNGHLQDLRDAYSATKNEFKQVWLSENRPYWLDNVLVRYDLEIQKWQRRGWQFSEAQHAMGQPKGLPEPQELGLPAAQ